MYDSGLLHRLDRRIGGVNAGSAGFVYALSAAGQRLTSQEGPAGGKRLRRPWEPAAGFVDHVLAVSEVYVGLRERERAKEIEVLEFQAEPPCWRSWSDLHGAPHILKPDAYVALGVGDYELSRFIEVDRSTESGSVLRRKAKVYVDYWNSGIEQNRRGVFPSVIWLVPDEKRKAQLVEILSALPAETWQLFEVGLSGEAADRLGANN